MKTASNPSAMPLQIPLTMLLMLACAATAMLAAGRALLRPHPAYVVTGDAASSQVTPFGSGAALRNLLF